MRKRKLGWKKKKVKRMTYFVEEVSLWNHVGFLKKKMLQLEQLGQIWFSLLLELWFPLTYSMILLVCFKFNYKVLM